MPKVTLYFADGESVEFEARRDQPVLQAAYEAGFNLAKDCEVGDCQTCRAQLRSGAVEIDPLAYVTLEDEEVEAGAVLTCVSMAESDLEIELPYLRASLIPAKSFEMELLEVDKVAQDTFRLRASVGGSRFAFHPGQYVNVTVPGTGQQRSYSMASAPARPGELEFFIRALPDGVMSNYLRDGVAPGQALGVSGPHGIFYLRGGEGPLVMVAGGTGLAPMVSMLREMIARGETARPVTLCFGVNVEADLFYLDELAEIGEAFARFDLRVAVARPQNGWDGPTGFVTELLRRSDVTSDSQAYLCGPPAMLSAARGWFADNGLRPDRIYAEEFVPSGG